VKYLGVIFDKKLTWKLHIETIATKALRIFLSIYPILKSERLIIGAKLIIYKKLIRPTLTYVCPAWEFAADSYLLKLQRLQNRALRTICNLPRHTPIRDLHRSFKIPYHMITLHSYAGSKRALYSVMTMLLFAPLAKARHVIENINDSNLVAVGHTIDPSIDQSIV
jgi:hypothetical protein